MTNTTDYTNESNEFTKLEDLDSTPIIITTIIISIVILIIIIFCIWYFRKCCIERSKKKMEKMRNLQVSRDTAVPWKSTSNIDTNDNSIIGSGNIDYGSQLARPTSISNISDNDAVINYNSDSNNNNNNNSDNNNNNDENNINNDSGTDNNNNGNNNNNNNSLNINPTTKIGVLKPTNTFVGSLDV